MLLSGCADRTHSRPHQHSPEPQPTGRPGTSHGLGLGPEAFPFPLRSNARSSSSDSSVSSLMSVRDPSLPRLSSLLIPPTFDETILIIPIPS